MSMTNDVRAVIDKHLAALAKDLDQFEQTTHGSIWLSGGDAICGDQLEMTYDWPTAYNVSELGQRLRAHLRDAGLIDKERIPSSRCQHCGETHCSCPSHP